MDKRLENLHRALHPRAIAVVGARKLDDYMWLRNMSTFAGPFLRPRRLEPRCEDFACGLSGRWCAVSE